jgi:hypothetical protein
MFNLSVKVLVLPNIGEAQNVKPCDRNSYYQCVHTAFIKYPEGDGGPNLDYEWIAPDQSVHIAKAILQDLAASGYQIVKK